MSMQLLKINYNSKQKLNKIKHTNFVNVRSKQNYIIFFSKQQEYAA